MQNEIYVFPMSFAQQRLWLLDRLEGGSAFYNIATAVRLRGRLDVAALDRALSGVVARHEALRTSFGEEDGEPVQLVHQARSLVMEREDVPGGEDALPALMAEEAGRPFDLATDLLLRARLVRLREDDAVLLLTMHHIVSDGWSMGVLVREVSALYRGETDLPELEIQYPDYTEWQRESLTGPSRAQLEDYWRGHLAGAPPLLALPTDRPRPAAQAYDGASVSFRIDAATTEGLRALAQQAGGSLFMALLAGYGVLLSRLSGSDDVVIGTPVANRLRPEIEPLIGFFVNTLPLRLDLSDSPSFAQLVAQARRVSVAAMDHQDLPFEMIVEAVQPQRTLSHAPLFQAMLTLQSSPGSAPEAAGLSFEMLDVDKRSSLYDLTVEFSEHDGGLVGRLEYSTALFLPDTASRFARLLTGFLAAAVREPNRSVASLPLHDGEAETGPRFAPVPAGAPPVRLVHEAVAAQAARTPDAVALRCDGVSLTYAQVRRRVVVMAAGLRCRGVGRGHLVGIGLRPGFDLISAVLAVLEIGAAYVPLDPEYPAERLAQMTADAQLALTIDAETVADLMRGDGIGETAAAGEAAEPGDLIYAIFTSGSTGRPKLAGVEHAGVARLLQWYIGEFGLTETDTVLLLSSPSFDLTQKNLFAPLMVGATLVLPGQTGYDPARLTRTVQAEGVRVLNCTPSAFLPLIEQDNGPERLASVRLVFLGGEPIPVPRLLPWWRGATCQAEVVNTYGPTECTDVVAFHRLDPEADPREAVPVGRPVWGAAITVQDAAGHRLPPGLVGEIHVHGDGVGRGYLNDAAATAEKFRSGPTGRAYATGDLGRIRPDGAVVFLGRRDHQIKVRGYRIEPGEIEVVLAQHPQVRDVAVSAWDDALIAHVVAEDPAQPPSVAEMRAHLRRRLPHYMVPQTLVLLERMPLTPSGKVDRARLPRPDPAEGGGADVVPARSDTERRVLTVWQEVLAKTGFGVTDDFFALGGHSLLAAQVASRLQRAFGVEVSMRSLFEHPTVAQLAELLEREEAGLAALLDEMDTMDEAEVERLLAVGAGGGE